MITQTQKDLLHWAKDYALKNGCQAVRILFGVSNDSTVSIRNMETETISQSIQNAVQLSLFSNGRYAVFTTNRLEKSELASFIKDNIAAMQFLAVDEDYQLPDKSRYFNSEDIDLQQFDENSNSISIDKKVELAKEVCAEIYQKDSRIISANASFANSYLSSYLLDSNGFEGERKFSSFSLFASTSVKTEGDARPSDYWNEDRCYFSQLSPKGIGEKAMQRAFAKLGARKTSSGIYPMLVDVLTVPSFLNPIINALSGTALHQKRSFLLSEFQNRKNLEKAIFSEKMTLIDEPHIIGNLGANLFDKEGVATQRRILFDSGFTKDFFISTYSANKLKVQPTISEYSTLVMPKGERSFEQIIADLPRAILVTGLNGGNCNETTGDFSFGIEGFLIKDGKIEHPIQEMIVTGNMISLWKNLAEIANETREYSASQIPALLFDNVQFNGI